MGEFNQKKILPLLAFAYLVAILLFGIQLRWGGVFGQLVGGDEVHAVRAARKHSYGEIVQYYDQFDNSIPWTIYSRLLMDTVGLNEWKLRLPAAAASTLLFVVPLMFRRRLGFPGSIATISLFATSPFLVYYSFVARPYSVAALLLFLCLYMYLSWSEEPTRRRCVLFGLCSAVSISMQLLCVFPVAGLFAAAFLDSRTRKGGVRELLRVLILAVGVVLLLLLPGMSGLIMTRLGKVGGQELNWTIVVVAYQQLTGFVPGWGIILCVLVLAGLMGLRRRDPVMARALSFMVGAAFLGVLASRPTGQAIAWARYAFLVWPLLLMVAAAGLVSVFRLGLQAARRERWAPIVGVLAAGGFALWGYVASPIGLYRASPTSFRVGKAMMRPASPAGRVPLVYEVLRERGNPGDLLLEHPYIRNEVQWAKLNRYQQFHQMRVKMADTRVAAMRAEGIRYWNVVDLNNHEELMRTGARFLNVRLRYRLRPTKEELRKRYGNPVYADDEFELYELNELVEAG